MDTHPEELTESQRSERSRVRGYKQRSRPPQRHRASIPRHPSTTIRPDQARLFVAFEAPSVFVDAATTAQQFFQDHWRADRNSATDGLLLPARPPVRWTNPDSWHITLHFMGTTPRELVPQVTKRLDEIASQYPPITLVIKTIAGLPPPIRQQRLRVICLEIAERVSGTVSTLPVLVNALAAQLAQFSITIDPADEQRPLEQAERKRPHVSTKPYTPHLTLGRVKDWANSASVEQLWSLIKLASNGAWSCTRTTNVCFAQFTLYESVWERESSSPLYKPLGHFMLRNGEATTA
ncbi:hypothetical protein F1559_003597 [Cyanidiococcus yangmingshanensis]|uniref:Phosphoesterase HXTX domain-containing protein n=1 Tax=Cyanidiococcus yangmingshanensis TaxID=2690220 RepID=A0A7J7IEB2_9RHOD|nr:hypothetical protein F1559_003597 [Cyanidiococcus yangmingshanensis]